ncbi:hypothetical protein U3516DRAFT_600792 [Neocallimastix sp. 'constans']
MSETNNKSEVKNTERLIVLDGNDPSVIPESLQRPELWNYESKKENIFFTTTSNDYGYYKPVKAEMPTKYFSINHDFSNTTAQTAKCRTTYLNS